MRIELQIPYPPSTNKLTRNVRGRGRVKTNAYEQWLRLAGWNVKYQKAPAIFGAYTLTISARKPDNRKRDIDNLIKPISDLLVSVGVVKDDQFCKRVTAEWLEDGDKENVTVVIEHIAAEKERAA